MKIISKIKNILVFSCILVIGLELLSAMILKIDTFYQNQHNLNAINKYDLPNYKNYNWAKLHFEEFPKVPIKYKSYVGWRRLYFKGETINVDSNGIRNTIQDTNMNDSIIVAFLGGSTIWGTGVNDSNTIPSIFSKRTKIKCVNFGETSYTAFQSYLFLQLSVLNGFKPSKVISYDGVNNSPINIPKYFSHSDENIIQSAIDEGQNCRDKKQYFFRNIFDLYNLFISRLSKYKNATHLTFKKNNTTDDVRAATELLESWLITKKLCEEIGADFICILQPNAYFSKPNIENIKHILNDPSNEDFYFKYGYNYYYTLLNMLETEKYNSLKNNFINLTYSLDSIPNIYVDFCHLSPNGNEVISDKIIFKMSELKNFKL